jgi:DNA-binding SARP family transcriptional activator
MANTDQAPGRPLLCLLGGIALRGAPAGVSDRLLTQSKAVALLAYLSFSPREAFQRRDRIVGLLWPEQDQQHARAQLRNTIHQVRSFLGDNVFAVRGNEGIALNYDCLSCDVVELREAFEKNRLGRVLDLYKGDLMPGFYLDGCADFEAWLEDRRKELHELATNSCLELAMLFEAEASGTKAGQYARRAVRLAGGNERILRRCLIMLDRLGDRAGALDAYDEFAKRLRLQMDAEPSQETKDLAEALRTGKSLDRWLSVPAR